jgi:voltage-gated potassium channel
MVAKVPLFSQLDADAIADIMRLSRSQQVEAGATIVRRGDPAHSMYFIAAGEVEIELPHKRRRLGVGHFFGEVAVLRRARRAANVTALTRTSLLVLDAHDLHALMERNKRIAECIHEVARSRVKRTLVTPQGDIVSPEIDEEERTARVRAFIKTRIAPPRIFIRRLIHTCESELSFSLRLPECVTF